MKPFGHLYLHLSLSPIRSGHCNDAPFANAILGFWQVPGFFVLTSIELIDNLSDSLSGLRTRLWKVFFLKFFLPYVPKIISKYKIFVIISRLEMQKWMIYNYGIFEWASWRQIWFGCGSLWLKLSVETSHASIKLFRLFRNRIFVEIFLVVAWNAACSGSLTPQIGLQLHIFGLPVPRTLAWTHPNLTQFIELHIQF